ncbi:hypothetical protein [Paenibacillus silvae]|uniref:hypothetical protein n=2 Tax=Paenibacillus silvae TaxID=1325358 RepID=UPI002004D960|nr:hypothetical protein [Paenibacillus silvae]
MLFIFYKMPYNIEQDYTASTLNGDTIEIKIKVKGYRNFFKPTSFKGKMSIDNQAYDVFEPNRTDSLITKIEKKQNGEIYFPIITNQNRTESDDFYVIQWTDHKFNKLYFIHAKTNFRYLAPAKNASTANQILEEIQHYLK